MNKSDYNLLSRLFSRNSISNILNDNKYDLYIDCAEKYLDKEVLELKSNAEVIEELYKILSLNYRNEYFYKNTVLNKLLLGRHSVNTTIGLTEIPIAKSKADFILINGNAVVYEIKSDIDSLERLQTQIDDYYKVFQYVNIVTCKCSVDKLEKLITNSSVGIIELTKRNQLSIKKEAVKNKLNLDFVSMFNVLRKKEYEYIILKYFKSLPEVPPVKYYQECLRLIKSLDINDFYDDMVSVLKKRNINNATEFKSKVPYELKFLLYFINSDLKDYLKLEAFLTKKIGG